MINPVTKEISRFLKALPFLLICLGIFLRLFHYLHNRSLWLDEAEIATHIINSSISDFIKPPIPFAAESLGYLIIEKLALFIFGNNEYSLRLLPLTCGIASIFIFYQLAKAYLNYNALLIATGLFVQNKYLIYYSSEVRRYSVDVFATLLLLLFAEKYSNFKKLSYKELLIFSLMGGATLWFSSTALFVIPGIATGLYFINNDRNVIVLKKYGIMLFIWAISFAVYYYVYLSHTMDNALYLMNLPSINKFKALPFPPVSLSEVRWFLMTFFNIFKHPVGLSLTGLAALTFIVGFISMLFDYRRNVLILILPVIITLVASAFKLYPVWERYCLFWVPTFLIFIASGTETIRSLTWKSKKVIGVSLLSLIFIFPTISVCYHLVNPYSVADIKKILSYVNIKKQNDEKVYFNTWLIGPFKYYQKWYNINDRDVIFGNTEAIDFTNDLKTISKFKKVWVILGMIDSRDEAFIVKNTETVGEKMDFLKIEGTQGMPVSHISGNISAYLFHFPGK